MNLEENLVQIIDSIRKGGFLNEAAVSQGVVLRLLHVLGWPIYDTDIVAPEYTVENKRVDYALCHPPKKPVVFVEVKRIGNNQGAESQLFEYAFYMGVPMAILTDGQEWHFFLPTEVGRYQDRRVYKLDLLERTVHESAERLERYLSYEAVRSGQAIQMAKHDYHNVTRDREIQKQLPLAFAKLIADQDEGLLELLADQVESLCGYKPELDVVADFLVNHASTNIRAFIPTQPVAVPPEVADKSHGLSSVYGFTFQGIWHSAKNPTEVYFNVFEALAQRDATFLARFAALPKHGKKRRYVAATKEELYPGRPDFVETHAHQLSSGWWVGTNYSTATKRQIIQLACEVAGIEFGRELLLKPGD